ncbi:unnamed protein product, partial [Menidia menidia]
GVLGDGLGALGHGVLGQFSGQQQAHGGLDLPGGDGGPFVVVSQAGSLGGDALKDVVHEGVHDAHGVLVQPHPVVKNMIPETKHGLDVGQHAALSDGHSAQELVQLLIVTHGQLKMAGDDPGLLVVTGSVTGQFQDLSGQVLQDGGQIHGGTGPDPLGVVSLPQQPVDTAHGELEPGPGGAGNGVPDDVLQEHLQHPAGLLVDEAGDSLHTATASQTTDGGLVYLELVYLVTALVPSDTACLASSPGSSRRTAVWISLEVMVDLLL